MLVCFLSPRSLAEPHEAKGTLKSAWYPKDIHHLQRKHKGSNSHCLFQSYSGSNFSTAVHHYTNNSELIYMSSVLHRHTLKPTALHNLYLCASAAASLDNDLPLVSSDTRLVLPECRPPNRSSQS